jgi:hypothetical protein
MPICRHSSQAQVSCPIGRRVGGYDLAFPPILRQASSWNFEKWQKAIPSQSHRTLRGRDAG